MPLVYQELRRLADKITAQYDPVWKFPTAIRIDFLNGITDDKRCYEVNDLELSPFR